MLSTDEWVVKSYMLNCYREKGENQINIDNTSKSIYANHDFVLTTLGLKIKHSYVVDYAYNTFKGNHID